MNVFSSYRLLITPLSPVHIGTGESYQPTNYVIEDDILHEFDIGGVVEAFAAEDREALLKISGQRPNSDMIKELQRFFFERREALKAFAVNRIPVLPGVAQRYAQRIGRTANREADGGQVLNQFEIDRTGFDSVTRKPMLFGSSLKGAIRTALLDQVNDEQPLHDVRDQRTGKMRPENNQELQNRLLKYQPGKFEFDPFRLLHVSDASWAGHGDFPPTQVHLAVNRYKKDARDKHGNLLRPHTDKGPDVRLECVPGFRYREFVAQIGFQRLEGILETDRKNQRQIPSANLRFDISDLAKSCNDFYRARLLEENRTMRDRGYLDSSWEETIRLVLTVSDGLMKRGDAFLLRVGRHSGAESMTLNGVRNIKIMGARDRQTGKQRSSNEKAAKTLWLAADTKDQQTGLLPFGWLLVEIQPFDHPVQAWPELEAVCEPHLASARSFASKMAKQRQAMDESRARVEAKRRDDEEKARRDAEARAEAEREEMERRARLDAMTENQKRIHALKAGLNAANKGRGPGSQLYGETRGMIQQSADWPEHERAELHGAAIEVFDWLGIKKDDGNRKKLLRSLIAS